MNEEIRRTVDEERRMLVAESRWRGLKAVVVGLLLATVAFAVVESANAQELTFGADTTTGTEQVTPTLTWSTDPEADSCTASGDWSGEKGGSGSETLAPITSGATYNLTCEWALNSAIVSWTPPTENTDGSPLTDLDGYFVYYGTSDGGPYDNSVQLDNEGVTTYVIEDLTAGTWYFVGSAYNELGIESDFSNQAQKTVIGDESASESVGITVNPRPNPMGGFGVQ